MTQHRRLIRRGAFTGAVAIGAIVLAGCSGTTDDADGSSSFSLGFPVSNEEETAYEILATQYMDEHPDVEITINRMPGESYNTNIRTQLQGGNAPDVFLSAPGNGQAISILPLGEAGLVEPLGDTAAGLIPEGSEHQFEVDGTVYGQPLNIAAAGVVFNQTAAEAAGITEYPSDWQGVLAACETVAATGGSFFVVAGAVGANAGMMAQAIAATRVYADTPDWNTQRADGDVTFADSEGWADTLQAVVDMNDAGCFQGGVEGAGFDAITNGLVQGTSTAMFGPSGTTRDLTQAADGAATFLAETFPPVDAADGVFGFASSTYSYSIAASSENKEAAHAFLDWMAEPEQAERIAEESGTLPITGYADMDFTGTAFEPLADMLANGDFVPLPNSDWANSAVYDALGAGVQGLFTGQKSVDQVLADLDSAWGE
ncbi:ABC transporter substrate-binding protein [Microbacterium gilvum]|uniref:Extracellular solute-binding protein n=1 Tax=Microbacterium gilvum TaxID=1336204 RepID=A0ABP9AN11_9MICO